MFRIFASGGGVVFYQRRSILPAVQRFTNSVVFCRRCSVLPVLIIKQTNQDFPSPGQKITINLVKAVSQTNIFVAGLSGTNLTNQIILTVGRSSLISYMLCDCVINIIVYFKFFLILSFLLLYFRIFILGGNYLPLYRVYLAKAGREKQFL